jgi:hypothetical protein
VTLRMTLHDNPDAAYPVVPCRRTGAQPGTSVGLSVPSDEIGGTVNVDLDADGRRLEALDVRSVLSGRLLTSGQTDSSAGVVRRSDLVGRDVVERW